MFNLEREPSRPHMRSLWTIGADLGQSADYTAVVAVEQLTPIGWSGLPIDESAYSVRHLERMPLGTPFPKQVERIAALLATPELVAASLVVDGTGVGRPVMDLLRAADLPHGLTAISI